MVIFGEEFVEMVEKVKGQVNVKHWIMVGSKREGFLHIDDLMSDDGTFTDHVTA